MLRLQDRPRVNVWAAGWYGRAVLRRSGSGPGFKFRLGRGRGPAARQYPGAAGFETRGLPRHMGDPIRVISDERVLLLSELRLTGVGGSGACRLGRVGDDESVARWYFGGTRLDVTVPRRGPCFARACAAFTTSPVRYVPSLITVR